MEFLRKHFKTVKLIKRKRQSHLPFRVLLTISSDGMGRRSYLQMRTYIIYSRKRQEQALEGVGMWNSSH